MKKMTLFLLLAGMGSSSTWCMEPTTTTATTEFPTIDYIHEKVSKLDYYKKLNCYSNDIKACKQETTKQNNTRGLASLVTLESEAVELTNDIRQCLETLQQQGIIAENEQENPEREAQLQQLVTLEIRQQIKTIEQEINAFNEKFLALANQLEAEQNANDNLLATFKERRRQLGEFCKVYPQWSREQQQGIEPNQQVKTAIGDCYSCMIGARQTLTTANITPLADQLDKGEGEGDAAALKKELVALVKKEGIIARIDRIFRLKQQAEEAAQQQRNEQAAKPKATTTTTTTTDSTGSSVAVATISVNPTEHEYTSIPLLEKTPTRGLWARMRAIFWPSVPTLRIKEEGLERTVSRETEIAQLKDTCSKSLGKHLYVAPETATARGWRLSAVSALGVFYGAHKALKNCNMTHAKGLAIPCALASFFVLKPVFGYINRKAIAWYTDKDWANGKTRMKYYDKLRDRGLNIEYSTKQ